MTSVTIAVFIMMLISAALGFSIAWVYKNEKFQSLLEKYKTNKSKVIQLQDEQDSLVRHSNNLQAETLKSSQKIEKQNKRNQSLKDIIQQLENDKEFIFKEYEQFRKEVKEKLSKSEKFLLEFEEIKEKNQKLKLKADKWKIRFHETENQLQQTEASYLKVKKEKDKILENISADGVSPSRLLEWESNYKKLKLKYLALNKEKEHLESLVNQGSTTNLDSKDQMISKLSEEIVILKRQNKSLSSSISEKGKPLLTSSKDKESVLKRIRSRSKQVDFKRIGKANPRSKDNLKDLRGLGNLIEQKFHAIGINTFEQISNFNEYDQKLFNFFLELPQGKIESEKWVLQAQKIMQESRIKKKGSENLEKIDFDSASGEASPSQKDNLQSILGIGPFIEQKLNAIGIFRLEQLARLTPKDIEEINGIMKLAPDHIKNDDWVGQAKRMK